MGLLKPLEWHVSCANARLRRSSTRPTTMFGFIKNMLRKAPEQTTAVPQAPGEQQVPPPPPAPAPPVAAVPAPPLRREGGSGHVDSDAVELPLQKVLDGFPAELASRIRLRNPGAMTIAVPMDKVLPQLARGAVKITYGELRHATPHVFTSQSDRDQAWVTLP